MQLLASPRYKEMMETLKENFDVILVDTPSGGRDRGRGGDCQVLRRRDHRRGVQHRDGKQDIAEVAASIAKTGCQGAGRCDERRRTSGTFRNRKYYYRSGRYSSYYNRYGKSYGKSEGREDGKTAKRK